MALGKRKRQHQDTFWVAADKLGKGPRNAFYDRLNELLDEIGSTPGERKQSSRSTRRPDERACLRASTFG